MTPTHRRLTRLDPPMSLGDDCIANRKAWAQCLRLPDWQELFMPNLLRDLNHEGIGFGSYIEGWAVGVYLADEYWPYASDDVPGDLLMKYCYGLRTEDGEFDPGELPDNLRRTVLMAAAAAQHAPAFANPGAESSRANLADLPNRPVWLLSDIGDDLGNLWRHTQSPMQGAVLDYSAMGRLIADVLDAAPPSLLVPAED